MSERRKLTKRKREVDVTDSPRENELNDKPAPVEYEVAKYLRAKLPEKKTTFVGVKVDYFIASKAIDCLLDSKWALRPQGSEQDALFTTRESVAEFLDLMLRHKFFHRAKKIIVKEKKKKKDTEKIEYGEDKTKGKEEGEADKDASKSDKKDKKYKKDGTNKEKKKVKLDMHLEQYVVDSNEPYVWVYEPISIKSCIFGFLLVFGVVAVCLFPLWPSSIRTLVYYLSLAIASFLLFIIGLALLKLVIFVIVWGLTFGKHYFWIFPNLTEDVGFFESFWPLYQYERKSESDQNEPAESTVEKKKKKSKKAEENIIPEEKEALISETRAAESVNEEVNESEVSENDSIENNGFEIVNDKDVPPILNLKF